MNKKQARLRRTRKTRDRIRRRGAHRLCVHRTPRHLYAQIIAPGGADTLACASTLERDLAGDGGRRDAAGRVGAAIAERALKKGIREVAFDRSGFSYHGRIKLLADAARAGGLQF